MGLCEKGRLPLTENCDYSIPTVRVFNTMSKELIIHDKCLQALTCSPRQHPPEATPGMASWPSTLRDRCLILKKDAAVGVGDMLSLLPIWYKAATGCDFDANNEAASGDSYTGTTYD
jgi:hypothetical protein